VASNPPLMEVGIVAQHHNDRAAALAGRLRERLDDLGVGVALDEATATALSLPGVAVETFEGRDLVVSIGGDGTFLFAARNAGGTPIVGVNLGEVGFLNAVGPAEAVETVTDAVAAHREGDLDVRSVPRIAASHDGWTGEPAVNEVVVHGTRRGHGGGVDVEIRIDGSLYDAGHADGVLVATPTGSTAYNLSERGPLVHPDVGGLLVTEMALADGMPPLVVGPDSEVTVTVSGADAAVVVGDGRNRHRLTPPATVTVATADSPVRLAGPQADFFQALDKLD